MQGILARLRSRTGPILALVLALTLGAGTGPPSVHGSDDPAPPVGEPGKAAPSDAPEAEAAAPASAPVIERISDSEFRLGSITFDRISREIRFPARINMNRGMLEYAIVHESGKLHESLLVTDVRPFDLNVVVLLCGFKPAREVVNPIVAPDQRVPEDSPEARENASMDVAVVLPSTEDQDGETSPAPRPLASMIRHLESRKAAAPGPWIYNGSLVEKGAFLAELDGSILALYLDHRAMINNPREGNFNDDIWSPMDGLPEVGTPVTVRIRPFRGTESPSKN